MEEKRYLIFQVSESHKIDFSKVMQNSIDTLRISIDGSKTFVKWEGDCTPKFVEDLETKEGPYTHEEIRKILVTEEWSKRIPGISNDYSSLNEEEDLVQ